MQPDAAKAAPLVCALWGTQMIEIREALAGDIEGINIVSTYLGYSPSSIEVATNRLEEIIASDSDHVWVYLEDNTVKGWLHLFVSLRLASPKFAEIGGLVVDESSRRKGIGGKLVGEAIKWSKVNQLPLRVRCNTNREQANRFYESLGFVTKKTQKIHEFSSS
jgi:GNAT superfamily N-acetyltransferase